jgi:hypothetical protein
LRAGWHEEGDFFFGLPGTCSSAREARLGNVPSCYRSSLAGLEFFNAQGVPPIYPGRSAKIGNFGAENPCFRALFVL